MCHPNNLTEGEPVPDGECWYTVLTNDRHITSAGTVHAQALKGRRIATSTGMPWSHEMSGRLVSLSGDIAAIEADARQRVADGTSNYEGADWDATPSFGVWRNILQSCDLSSVTLHFAAYQSDVLVGSPYTPPIPLISLGLNGNPFVVGSNTTVDSPATCDMAEFQLWSGVSIVETDDTILTANRRLFIDGSGKPVAPSIAVAALGTPTLQLIGTAASWTSLLTGYGFTIAGTLTNASSSPSDNP